MLCAIFVCVPGYNKVKILTAFCFIYLFFSSYPSWAPPSPFFRRISREPIGMCPIVHDITLERIIRDAIYRNFNSTDYIRATDFIAERYGNEIACIAYDLQTLLRNPRPITVEERRRTYDDRARMISLLGHIYERSSLVSSSESNNQGIHVLHTSMYEALARGFYEPILNIDMIRFLMVVGGTSEQLNQILETNYITRAALKFQTSTSSRNTITSYLNLPAVRRLLRLDLGIDSLADLDIEQLFQLTRLQRLSILTEEISTETPSHQITRIFQHLRDLVHLSLPWQWNQDLGNHRRELRRSDLQNGWAASSLEIREQTALENNSLWELARSWRTLESITFFDYYSDLDSQDSVRNERSNFCPLLDNWEYLSHFAIIRDRYLSNNSNVAYYDLDSFFLHPRFSQITSLTLRYFHSRIPLFQRSTQGALGRRIYASLLRRNRAISTVFENLRELDLTGSTILDSDFQDLWIQFPRLNFLNLGSVTNLDDARLLELATAIRDGGLRELRSLNLSNNPNITGDGLEAFFRALGSNTNLREVFLVQGGIPLDRTIPIARLSQIINQAPANILYIPTTRFSYLY